jgi:hypothetical protein
MEAQERDIFDLLLQQSGAAVLAIPTVTWENIEKAVQFQTRPTDTQKKTY